MSFFGRGFARRIPPFGVALLAGCALHLVPIGPPGSEIDAGRGSITVTQDRIALTLAPRRSVRSAAGTLVVPVVVAIRNLRDRPLEPFSPRDFLLFDAGGNEFSALVAPDLVPPGWGGVDFWGGWFWQPGPYEPYGWRMGRGWGLPPSAGYDFPPPWAEVPVEPGKRLTGTLFFPAELDRPGDVVIRVRKNLEGSERL